MTSPTSTTHFPDLKSFYPFYLSQHAHGLNRLLHFYGTTLVLLCLVTAGLSRQPVLLFWALAAGYGPAWVGHFIIEKNRPATFRYPFKSLVCDFMMYRDIWRGKL
jgi:hypothetical protein